MDLSRFPRVSLARLPTPIERLERLSAHLGGPTIYVKRDDETGLGLGGNKLRKLEFLLGEALAQGADTILTIGALQSNHARQTAAACAKLGLACELVLRRSTHVTDAYLGNGNVLLDRLFGARVTLIESHESREETMVHRAEELRAAGRKPYCIPVGGSCATGNLGYAACAEEVLTQARTLGLAFAAVVVATGSGGTQGGLVAGLHALGSPLPVVGIAVEGTRAEQEQLAHRQAAETVRALGAAALPRETVTVLDEYAGPGYARPTEAMREALRLAARFEGLVLDPVYTGKAFSGLIDLVRRGRFGRDESVLFLHTGGSPGLFAYPESVA
ncbi:MAG: D-cysteine desulfhydrase [Rhodocyclales bacterium]|nr:D-cysteine desulfhydrase [Rhodocyclales bacterium]